MFYNISPTAAQPSFNDTLFSCW